MTNNTLPIGPLVDDTPRPLPARTRIRGRYVELEPLHPRHAPQLWHAAAGADDSWTYMPYGPFAQQADLARHVANLASQHDPVFWAARPVATGLATGWLSLMNIAPHNADIEIGHIWFAPAMQRTRAATEAMVLLLRLAADDLGYRRLVWRCHALNAPSRRAAERLGFVYEGTLRADRVIKGRSRDTAVYSIQASEWPACGLAMARWLAEDNVSPDGVALRGLASFRKDPA